MKQLINSTKTIRMRSKLTKITKRNKGRRITRNTAKNKAPTRMKMRTKNHL